MVVLHQLRLGDGIVGMEQEPHRRDYHVDGKGAVEAERLVGHQSDILQPLVVGEGIGNVGDVLVDTYEDSYARRLCSSAYHLKDGVEDTVEDIAPVVVGGQQLYAHAAVVALAHHLLRHVGICR